MGAFLTFYHEMMQSWIALFFLLNFTHSCFYLNKLKLYFIAYNVSNNVSSCSWISVLTNSKEEALNMAFRGEQSSGGEDGLEDLTKAIIEDVLRMPGNEVCCDCGAAGVFLLLFVGLRESI